MSLDPYPDVMKAVLDRLRAHPGVALLTAGRVSAELQTDWAMPTHAVVVHRMGGSTDDASDIMEQVMQVDAFGPKAHNSVQLAAQVDAALRPLDRHNSRGFTLAHCIIHDVRLVEGMVNVPLADGRWPRHVQRYAIIYARRYAP